MTNLNMTIISSGWRLCLEYPSSCYSRQPRLGLATYSLFASLVCYSRQPRLGLATYSLFALWLCLFVILSVSRLTQKRLALNF